MTIHGLQYRPAPYTPTGRLQRLWPLAAIELRALFRGIWGVLLYVACALPTLGRLFFLLIWLGVVAFGPRDAARHAPSEMRAFVPTNVEFFIEQIVAPEQGMMVFLLLTAFVTARAIAKDRATSALELYWTRGISPFGYFAAKWFGTFLLVGSLTVAAPLLLWLVGVLFAEDWSFFEQTAGFMPRALLGLLVFTSVLNTACILVSAIAGSANLAMVLWCMLLVGGTAVGNIAGEIMRRSVVEYVSLWDAAATVARGIAGIAQDADVGGALVLLLGVPAILGLVVFRRLRITEAVG